MQPEQWNRVVELFQAAREKTGGERIALLDSACSDDPALRRLVEQMLRDDEVTSSFLNESPLGAQRSREFMAGVVAGVKFGRYEIVAPIGRGGMGEVWKARDPELSRDVALKFLAPETGLHAGREGAPPGAMERLTREARAASALNHPNIVTVHEVIRHGETSIIVMELIEGTSLRALCGTAQPLDRLAHIGSQIARALAIAHAHGIVHRDIKPENILVRNDGYVKLLDFGLARQTGAETLSPGGGFAGGTLRYMSPEQARCETISSASDIFSFGLVLYELAAGRPAFPGDSPFAAVSVMLTSEPAAPSSMNRAIPARWNSLILAMLAKDPATRPTAEKAAQVLEEFQKDAKGASRFRKWTAAALVLTFALFVTWYWKRARDRAGAASFRQITTLVPENRATAAAISPDGNLLAYANADGIFVSTIRNGATRTLPGPDNYVVDRLAWSPDGANLIASGFSAATTVPDIWRISTTGAPPRLLRTRAREATPSPDGTRIAFISQDRSVVWVMAADGQAARAVTQPTDRNVILLVLWSPDCRRVAFQNHHFLPGRDYYSYESVDLASGKTVAQVRGSWMNSAAVLPDGRVLFLQWDSADFTSSRELWEVQTNLATGAFVGKPHRIARLDGEETNLMSLSAAANGKQAVVLRRYDQKPVFVADFAQPPPRISNIRRLTFDDRTDYPHAWTADNRAVIFESNRNGNFDLFKQYVDRRTPESLIATPYTEMLPQLSPDGRFVLYAAKPPEEQKSWFYLPGTYRLMRVPVGGGTPAEVPIGGMLDEFRCALASGARCVLRTSVPGEYRAYFDLDPIRGKGRELARVAWSSEILGDWDVSPDGKYVAIPNHESREARIRVVSLEPGLGEARERDLVLNGLTDLNGLVWAADGSGWFVSVNVPVSKRLFYVCLDGRIHPLGDIQGWAVPSPDGRHVAFLNNIIATNAWLIERR